jgi:hypothetical protein
MVLYSGEESHSSTSCDWGLDLGDDAVVNATESGERLNEKKKMKRKKRKKSTQSGRRSASEHSRDQRGVVDDAQNRSEIHGRPKLKRNNVWQNGQHSSSMMDTTQEQQMNASVDMDSIGSYRGEQSYSSRSDLGFDLDDATMTERTGAGKLPDHRRERRVHIGGRRPRRSTIPE